MRREKRNIATPFVFAPDFHSGRGFFVVFLGQGLISAQLSKIFGFSCVEAFYLFLHPRFLFRSGVFPIAKANQVKIFAIYTTRRTTPIVVSAEDRNHAIAVSRKQWKQGYGAISSVQELKDKDAADARAGKWVRRRESGLSPDRGTAAERRSARRQRSRYRPQLAEKSKRSLET
jgi:hypothetical protein